MIIGHNANQAHLETALASGRLHHAYLLAGQQGLGKASLAKGLLPNLLGEGSQVLLAADAHPDFKVLTLIADPKTGKMRSEITRDQVTEVLAFLGKFSALSPRKVVLIDAIDDLNVSAANSLLKWLEEPRPGTSILAVCHRPGSLLPTLTSRCAKLTFQPLSIEDFRRFAKAKGLSNIATLFALSGGVPGLALTLDDPGIEQSLATFARFLESPTHFNAGQVWALAHESLPKADSDRFRLNLRLLRHSLRQLATPFAAEAYGLLSRREAQVTALKMEMGQVWGAALLDLHELAKQRQAHAL